jgi:protein-S-isoprenylcysteine O-methyltransferase Ste14
MAYAGTFMPFLLIFARDAEGSVAPTLLAIGIMTVGMLFALYSLHYLGRSFGIMPQARNLVRSGPYRFIRHPLYAGEIVAFGGAILVDLTIYKMGIFVMLCAIQLYRAVQEEKLLEETIPEYSEYKTATTRFIPGLL